MSQIWTVLLFGSSYIIDFKSKVTTMFEISQPYIMHAFSLKQIDTSEQFLWEITANIRETRDFIFFIRRIQLTTYQLVNLARIMS